MSDFFTSSIERYCNSAFPSPCGELRVSDPLIGRQELFNHLFKFPSPCGELRVSDAKTRWGFPGSRRGEFPSPCGELRVSDEINGSVYKADSLVSVPLRGIEGV